MNLPLKFNGVPPDCFSDIPHSADVSFVCVP